MNMFFAVIETRRSTCGSQDVQVESLILVFLKKKRQKETHETHGLEMEV